MYHDKSAARRKMKSERHNEKWKEWNKVKVQHGKSAAWRKCNNKRVQHGKAQYGKSAILRECNTQKCATWKSATWKECNAKNLYIGNSKTWREYNMKKVQHDQNIVTEWIFEKIVEEECTKMHKWIMGNLLKDCYKLFVFMLYIHFFEVPQRIVKIKAFINFSWKVIFSRLRLKNVFKFYWDLTLTFEDLLTVI